MYTDEEIKKTLQHLFREKKKVRELQKKLQEIGSERNELRVQLEQQPPTPSLEDKLSELQRKVATSKEEALSLRNALEKEKEKYINRKNLSKMSKRGCSCFQAASQCLFESLIFGPWPTMAMLPLNSSRSPANFTILGWWAMSAFI